MALTSGSRLGVYEVLAALGAGGMGEVYRARDTKLGREVAIKILPAAFALDAERVARFKREAQVLASLNHPHIAQIYGLEEADGVQFLVMELVDGETLDQRIARGSAGPSRLWSQASAPSGGSEARRPRGGRASRGLDIDEALSIAKQITEALEAAHEKGIIHRDLKPANIALTKDGQVKVLDFGLAKAIIGSAEASPDNHDLANSPTITSPAMLSAVGVILGTAAYMSPEQAKGRPADKRSDIWAFGCVLYEMLTGKRPFEGDDVGDVLVSVMRDEPDWSALPRMRASIIRLLRRCLQKNRIDRLDSAGAARLDLVEAMSNPTEESGRKPHPARTVVAMMATAALALIAGAVAGRSRAAMQPHARIARLSMVLPAGQRFYNTFLPLIAVSPDGTQVAYAVDGRLYLREMSRFEARALTAPPLVVVGDPTFSPDGRSVAVFADRALYKIPVDGSAPVMLCATDSQAGLSWGPDGILFSQASKGIFRISPNGGEPRRLISFGAGEIAAEPQMLPDGDHVLFTTAKASVLNQWEHAEIAVQSVRTGQRKSLLAAKSEARFVAPDMLLYADGGVLFAVRFDPQTQTVNSGPVPVLSGVRRANALIVPTVQVAVSPAGTLAYIKGPVAAGGDIRELVMLDRQAAAVPLKLPAGPYEFPRLSPDGRQLAFSADDGKEANVWVYDLSGASAARRLTFGGRNRIPVWASDGRRIAFQSDRGHDVAIWWQPADGTGPAQRLTKATGTVSHVPESWSPDGRLLFAVLESDGQSELRIVAPDSGKDEAFGGVRSTTRVATGAFSPDGRWVAYSAGFNPTVVYVQPFPPTGAIYQISKNDDGHHPIWSRDGRELFFVPGAGLFASVRVTTRPSFAFADPVPLPRGGFIDNPALPTQIDVMPDGQHFIGVIEGTAAGRESFDNEIEIVLNWFQELQARLSAK